MKGKMNKGGETFGERKREIHKEKGGRWDK